MGAAAAQAGAAHDWKKLGAKVEGRYQEMLTENTKKKVDAG